MLEPNVGEHGDRGVDHARGVVAPPVPGLDDGDVDLLLGHVPQRGGGEQFELGDVVVALERSVDPLGGPGCPRDRRRELIPIELASVHLDSLAIGHQVRRGVGGHAQAVPFEYRRDHPGGG